ncbi:MAG: diacylglycerol kinase family protein [Planctomycetota bacterium]
MSRVLIFANPYSGRRDNRKLVEDFERELSERGLQAQAVWGCEDRMAALRDAPDDTRAVVAAGGDGSIGDVINDMHAAGRLGLPFATLPVGTENLFAKEMGFRLKELGALAAAIARGETRAIDLGRLVPDTPDEPGRLFTLMVSAGFDAEVVRRVDAWRVGLGDGSLRRVRRSSYFRPILAAIFRYRYPRIRLVADEQPPIDGSQAYVFNLPQYGGELGIGRYACPDDGRLHWLVFTRPGLPRLLLYHLRCKLGQQKSAPGIVQGYAKRITVQPAGAAEPAPVQADGDPAAFVPLGIALLPGALRVIRV